MRSGLEHAPAQKPGIGVGLRGLPDRGRPRVTHRRRDTGVDHETLAANGWQRVAPYEHFRGRVVDDEDEVTVTLSGEVDGAVWFSGTTTLRGAPRGRSRRSF